MNRTRVLRLSLMAVSFAAAIAAPITSIAADSETGGGTTGSGGSPAGQPTSPDTKAMGGEGSRDRGNDVGARPLGTPGATTGDTRPMEKPTTDPKRHDDTSMH